MTFPKLVVHAALAGLYGGVVVVVLLRLANPAGGPAGPGSWVAPFVVVCAYALAAAAIWPVLYVTLRFFASHRLHLRWLSLRYVNGFFAANMAVLLGAGWSMLSQYRSGLAPPVAERLTRVCVLLTLAWLVVVTVAVARPVRRRTGPQAISGAVALLALLLCLRVGPAPDHRVAATGGPRSSDERPSGG